MLFALLSAMGANAQDTVRIDGSCATGSAFPMAIPVKLLPNDTAFYKWYCNGKYIDNSDSIATSTNRKITYTIPPNSNYSGDVVFHFTYRLNDDCCEWTSSPTYVVSFSAAQDCNLNVGSITIEYCGLDAGSVIVEYCDVGNITIEYCGFNAGSIAVGE